MAISSLAKTSFRVLAVFTLIFAGTLIAAFYLPGTQSAQDEGPDGSRFSKFERPDAVTDAVRDRGNELVSVSVRTPEERSVAMAAGTVVADYGSEMVIVRPKSGPANIVGVQAKELSTEISTPGKRFEPLELRRKESALSPGEKDYFLVQFAAYATDEWLASVKAQGADVIQYVPNRAFLVYADAAAAENLSAHSRVRWIGRYEPDHKMAPDAAAKAETLGGASDDFFVSVFKRAGLNNAHSLLSSIPGAEIIEVNSPRIGFFDLFRLRLDADGLAAVRKLSDVFRIDTYEEPRVEDERAAQIVAGNYSNTTTIDAPGYDPLTQFGVDGTGVTVAISDTGVQIPGEGGFYISLSNAVDGPLRGATAGAQGSHGHINASIVAGSTPFGTLDPTSYNYGRGIAPGANIINIPFLKTGNTTTDSQSVDDTVSTAGPNGVKGSIINNSWGAGTNGNTYDSFAALWDSLVFDASIAGTVDPITVVFSAGNSGTSGLTRPKMSKNSIAVANSENVRTELGTTSADNIDDMRSSSSRGPAADGRIKPDITAPGSYVSGGRGLSASGVSGEIDSFHVYSIGTSHAAPQVAGAAALFTQYWKSNNGGQMPLPSLVKAAILNTGLEMKGFGSTAPLPNGDEGWGRVNLKLMFDAGTTSIYRNESTVFSEPGNFTTITGSLVDPSKPLRVSLVWTDPPGASDPALVNDLDLIVTVGNVTFLGNVFCGGQSSYGGTSNSVDNVEMVRLPQGIPAGTPVSIRIEARALNGDGKPGNGDFTDQPFSLVAYNVSEGSSPPQNGGWIPARAAGCSIFDFDGDGRTDHSVFRPNPTSAVEGPAPEGSSSQWWIFNSGSQSAVGLAFGNATDVIAPADFTGDGKTDIAFFRPSTGQWYVLRSDDLTFFAFPFGTAGDIPAPGDFDGDGKADAAVFRPSQGLWFIFRSSDQQVSVVPFGIAEDRPTVADFDGDGTDDIAVFRPSASEWWQWRSTAGVIGYQFGTSGDRTVVGDYTGDGKADIAFFRPSTSEWYVLRSEDNSYFAFPFGLGTDIPVPGDYDGDGRSDAAIWRPSDNTWYILGSTNGFEARLFGAAGDVPLPSTTTSQ